MDEELRLKNIEALREYLNKNLDILKNMSNMDMTVSIENIFPENLFINYPPRISGEIITIKILY